MALTGTIAWGLTTVGVGISTAIAQINASDSRGQVDWSGLAAGSWAILGFCTCSLGVSIYGLTRTGSNPPSTALFGRKVRFGLPMIAPAFGGATLALTHTKGRFELVILDVPWKRVPDQRGSGYHPLLVTRCERASGSAQIR